MSPTLEHAGMPWSKQTLALPPNPASVRKAREWVARALGEIGRPELADSARLAVSELVTNALLHGDPPLAIQLRGTVEHPRIEVADGSLAPPQLRPRPSTITIDDDLSLLTVGRGLDLVACHCEAWGADIDARGAGKTVWFEPRAQARSEPVDGDVFDLDEAVARYAATSAQDAPEDMIEIELLGFPVELFVHLRAHFYELGRELRLLALDDPQRYPLAVRYASSVLRAEFERRQVLGLDELERAIEAGAETADLRYRIPASAPKSMADLGTLLDQIYETFAGDGMLALDPPPELVALQRWYLGEFRAQGAGEPPTRWDGPTSLVRRQEVS